MKRLAPFLPVAMLATASFLHAQAPAEPATPAVPVENAPAPADEGTYRTLTLASGLKLDLPKDWTVVRGSDSQPVEKVDAAFLKPQQTPQEGGLTTWLQALSPAGIGHASLTIQSSSGPTSVGLAENQKGGQTPSSAELTKMREAILHEESHALGLREMQQLSELKPVELSWHRGVEYQYQLAALPGGEQDAVDEIRILSGEREVHFLFTHPAGDATRWQSVFDHIRGSIHFPTTGEGGAAVKAEKKKGR